MGQADDDHPNKPLLFYKLMVASIIHDDKLKIPGKIVKKIGQELSVLLKISLPDGRKWNMKLGKDKGKCWFGDGWVEFMKYYNVRVGYLLVFRYKGDSVFVVNIFNLSNAEIKYLPNHVDGSERVKKEKHCLVSKRNPCVSADAQKKLDSAKVAKEKPACLLTDLKKYGNEDNKKLASTRVNEDKLPSVMDDKESGNEGNKKLASARVNEDKLPLVMDDKEAGNDDTLKMSCLAPQELAAPPSQSQNKHISDIISEILQSKLSELHSEVLSRINCEKGGSEQVQMEKRCSMNESACTMNRTVTEMTGHDKQCSVNRETLHSVMSSHTEPANNDSPPPMPEMTRKDKQCWVNQETLRSETSSHTELASNDPQKKSYLPPPGFGKSPPPIPDIDHVLNEKRGSYFGSNVNKVKPLDGTGSPTSFSLVKDVTPGYYRDNIMSSKNKKHPKTRKANDPRPANTRNAGSGISADRATLKSPSNKVVPEIHLSEMAHNVMSTNSLDTAAISNNGETIVMRTIADEDKELPEPDMRSSDTPLPKKEIPIPSASQLNVYNRVKRKEEINTADLLYNTAPTTVAAGHKVDERTSDVLNCTPEKTARVLKKQKTIQLSAISSSPVNPYCMIPMRYSYVQKKAILNIPTNFACKYLQKASGFAILQNVEGEEWKVRLISSNGRSKLSQGWNKFVEDNNLTEGDICTFELMDSLNTLFKVSFNRTPKDPPLADWDVLKL